MSFPNSTTIEMPILQELVAIGGADDVRYLYDRLTAYFPQITDQELKEIRENNLANWRKLVQRAGRELDGKGLLERDRGFWKITEKGREKVATEVTGFELEQNVSIKPSHADIQRMLLRIGEILGFYGETEFEYYDVVWREVPRAARLSHVFEVQSKGNIDSAFAKLKRAHEAQRSQIYLVVSSERDLKRAKLSLSREFQDIEQSLTIMTFAQIQKTYRNLRTVGEIISAFLES